MSNQNPNTSLAPGKKHIVLPARVSISETLRAILYGPGTVTMSVQNDGVRASSLLTAESALSAAGAAKQGDDGSALGLLLGGNERKITDRVGDYSFKRAVDDVSITSALAHFLA